MRISSGCQCYPFFYWKLLTNTILVFIFIVGYSADDVYVGDLACYGDDACYQAGSNITGGEVLIGDGSCFDSSACYDAGRYAHGGLIIGTINNGLNILQVQTFYRLVVMGCLIIAAVTLDQLFSKGK